MLSKVEYHKQQLNKLMLKSPTTSIIAIIVVAVVIICLYVLNTGKTTPPAEEPAVETATPQVVPSATSVETVVTPITATPAPTQ